MKANNVYCFVASLLIFGCTSRPEPSALLKTHTLRIFNGEVTGLQIELPQAFSVRRQEGPDFDVFYFSDTSKERSIGLYVGYYPNLHSNKSDATNVTRKPGRVGNIAVEWSEWTQDSRERSETLVRGFYKKINQRNYADLMLHIFTSANTKEDVEELQAKLTTLRLENSE